MNILNISLNKRVKHSENPTSTSNILLELFLLFWSDEQSKKQFFKQMLIMTFYISRGGESTVGTCPCVHLQLFFTQLKNKQNHQTKQDFFFPPIFPST